MRGSVVLCEHEHAVMPMEREEMFEIRELGVRGECKLSLASIRLHRAAALGAAGSAHDELAEASRARHHDPVLRDELAVDGALSVVLHTLVIRELHLDALGV